jgi:hypothetical protein
MNIPEGWALVPKYAAEEITRIMRYYKSGKMMGTASDVWETIVSGSPDHPPLPDSLLMDKMAEALSDMLPKPLDWKEDGPGTARVEHPRSVIRGARSALAAYYASKETKK